MSALNLLDGYIPWICKQFLVIVLSLVYGQILINSCFVSMHIFLVYFTDMKLFYKWYYVILKDIDENSFATKCDSAMLQKPWYEQSDSSYNIGLNRPYINTGVRNAICKHLQTGIDVSLNHILLCATATWKCTVKMSLHEFSHVTCGSKVLMTELDAVTPYLRGIPTRLMIHISLPGKCLRANVPGAIGIAQHEHETP